MVAAEEATEDGAHGAAPDPEPRPKRRRGQRGAAAAAATVAVEATPSQIEEVRGTRGWDRYR